MIALQKDYSILKFDKPSKQKKRSSRKADVSEFDPYFMIGLSSDSSQSESSGDSNDTLTEKMDGVSYDSHPHNGYHPRHATHMKLVEEEHKKVRKSKRKRTKQVVKSSDPDTNMFDDEVEEDSVTYSYISKRTYSIQSVNSAMLNTIANPEPYSALHQNKKSIKECVSRSDIQINRTVVKRESPPRSSTGSSSDGEFGDRVNVKKEPIVKNEVFTDEDPDICPQLVPSHYNEAYMKESPGPSSGKRAKRQAPKPPVPKLPVPKPPLPPRPKKQAPQASSSDYKAELDSYRARLDVLSDLVLKQESSLSNGMEDPHHHHHPPQPDYGGTDFLNTLSEKQFTNGLNRFLNDLMLRIQDKIQDGTIAFSEEEESESFDEIDEMDEEQIANSELVKPLFNTINQNRDYAKNEPMKTIGLSTAVLPTLALNMPHPSSSGLGSINTSCTTTQDSFHSIDITLPRENIGVQTDVIPSRDPGPLFKHTQTDGTHRKTHSSDNANDSSDLTQTKSDVSVGCTSSEDNTKLQTHDKGVGTDDLEPEPDASVYHSILSPGGSTSSSENKSPRRRSPHLTKSPAKGVSKSTATVYTFNSKPPRPRVVESLEPTSVDSSLSRNLKGGFTFSTDCSSYERIDGIPGVSDMSKPSSGDNLSDISTPLSTLDRDAQLPAPEGSSDATSTTQREIVIEEQHVDPVENNKPSDSPERHVTWSESVQHIDPPTSKETTPRPQVAASQDPLPTAQEQFFQEDDKIDDTGQIQVESTEVPMLAIAAAVDTEPVIGHVTADVNPFPFMNLRQVDIPRSCKRTFRSRPQTPIASRRRTYSDLDYPKERKESTDSGSNEKILNNSINNISSSQELAPNILPNLASAVDAGSRARNFSATSNTSNSNGDQVIFNNLGDTRSLNITGSRDSLTNISSFGSTSNIDNISYSLPEISESSFEEKKHNKPDNTDVPSTSTTIQSPTSNLDDPLGDFGSNKDNYSTATLRKPMNLTNFSLRDDGASAKDVSDNIPGPSHAESDIFEPDATEQSKINFNGSPSGKSKRTIVDGKNVPQFSEIKELPSEEVDGKCLDQTVSDPSNDTSMITREDSMVAEEPETSSEIDEKDRTDDVGNKEIPDDPTPDNTIPDLSKEESCVDISDDVPVNSLVAEEQVDKNVDENMEVLSREISHSPEVTDAVPVPTVSSTTPAGGKKGKKGKKGKRKNDAVHSLDTLSEDPPKNKEENTVKVLEKKKKGKKGKRGKSPSVSTVSYDLDLDEEPEAQLPPDLVPEETSLPMLEEIETLNNEAEQANTANGDDKAIADKDFAGDCTELSNVGAQAPENVSTVPTPEKKASVGPVERRIVFEARKLERRMSTGDENTEIASSCPRKRVPSCQSALWWEDQKQLKILPPESDNRSTNAQVNETDGELKVEPIVSNYSDIDGNVPVSLDKLPLNEDLSANLTDPHTISDSSMVDINSTSRVGSSSSLELNKDGVEPSVETGEEVKTGTNDSTEDVNITVPVSEKHIENPFIKNKKKRGKNKRKFAAKGLTEQPELPDQSDPLEDSDPHMIEIQSIPNAVDFTESSSKNEVGDNMKIEGSLDTDGNLDIIGAQAHVTERIKDDEPLSLELKDQLPTAHVDAAESVALNLDKTEANKGDDFNKNRSEAVDPYVQEASEFVTKSKKKKGKKNKKALKNGQFDKTPDHIGGMECSVNDDRKAPFITPPFSQSSTIEEPSMNDDLDCVLPKEDFNAYTHQLQNEEMPEIKQVNEPASGNEMNKLLNIKHTDDKPEDKTDDSKIISPEIVCSDDEFGKPCPWNKSNDDVIDTLEVADIQAPQNRDLFSKGDKTNDKFEPDSTATEASNMDPLVSATYTLDNDCDKPHEASEEPVVTALIEENSMAEVDAESPKEVSSLTFPHVVTEVLEAIPAKKKKKGKKCKGNKNADLNGESICEVPTSTGKKKGKGKKGKKKQIIPATSTATVDEGDSQGASQEPNEVHVVNHDVLAKDEEDVTIFKEIEPAPGEIVEERESNLSLENDLVCNDHPISFSEQDKVPLVEPTSLKTAEDSIIILAEKPELGNLDLSTLPPSISEIDRKDDNDVQGGRKSRIPDHSPKGPASDEYKVDPRRRTVSDDATIPFPRKPRRYSSLNLLPPSDLTGRSTSFSPEERFNYQEIDLSDTPKRKQAEPLTGSKEGVFPKTVDLKTNYKGPPIKPFRQSVSSQHHDTTLYPNTNNLAVASGRTRSLSENDPGISSKGDKKYRPEKFKDWLLGQIIPSRVKSSENYCQNDLLMSVPVGGILSTGDTHVRVGDDARLAPSHKTAEESLIATDGQSEQIDVPPPSINLERPTVLTLDRPFSYSGEKASTEDDEATPKPIQKTPSANDVLCSGTTYVNWLHTLSAIQDEKPGSVKNLLTVPKRPCHRKTHSEGQKIEVTFTKELSPVFEPQGKPPTPPPFASTHKVSSRPRVRSAIHASEETKTSPLSEAKTPSADDINKSWKGLLKSWILNNGGSQSKVKSSNDIRKSSSSKERRGSEIIETDITFPTEVNIPPKVSQIDLSSDTRSRENSRTESVSGVSTGLISNNEFSADIDSFLDSEIDKLKDDYVPQKPSKSKKKKKSKRKSTERDFSSPKFDNFDHVPNCPVVEVTPDTFEAAEDPCIQTIVPSNYERISHLFDDSVVPDNNEAPNIKSMNLPTERKRGSHMESADNKFDETTSIRSFEYDNDFDGAQSFTVSRYLDGALDKLKSRSVSNSSSSDGGFPSFPVQSRTTTHSDTVDKRDFGVSVDGCQGGKRGRLPGSSSFTHNEHLDDEGDAFKTRTSSGFNPSFEKSPSSEILKEIKSPPRLNVTSSFISFDRDLTPPQKPQRPAKPVLFSYVEDCARDEFREITDAPESSTFGNRSHSESELSVPEKEVKKSFKKQLFSRWGRQRTRSESKSCRDGKVDKSHGDGLDVLNASEQDMIMTPKKNVQVFKLADGREIKYDMETRKETVISNPNNVAHEVPPEIKSTSLLPVLDQLDRIQSTFDDLALCIADSSKPSAPHVRRANSLPGESSFGKLSGGKTPQTDQWGKEIDLDMKELTDLINNFCKDKGEYHNNSVEDILDAMVCSKERQSSDSFDSAHSNDSFKSITADKEQLNTISAKERKKKTLLSLLTDLSKSKSTPAINSSTSSSNGVGQSSRSEANISSLGHSEVMTDGILAAEVTNAPITAATMPVPTIVVDPPSTKTSKAKSKGFFENLKSKKYHTSIEDVTSPKSHRTRAYSDSRAYKEEKVGFFENLKSKKYHESDEFELDENGFLSHVLKTKKYHRSSDWIGPKRKVERGFSNALTRDPSIPQPRPVEQILIHDGPPMYHQQGPVRHICLDSDPIPQYYDDRSLPKQKMNDQRVDDKYSTLPKGRGRSISISPPEDSLWGSSQISERPDSSLRRTRFNSDCNNRPIPSRQRNYSDHTLHDIHSLPDIPGPDKIPRSRNKSSISNLSSITSPASDISTGFSDIDSLPNVPDHPLAGNLKMHMKRPDFLPLGVLTDTELDEVFSSIRETDDVDTKESSSGPSTMPVTSTPRRPTNLKLLNLSADRLVFDFGKESSESAPETPKLSDNRSAQIKGEEVQQLGEDEKDFDVQRDKTLSATHLKSSSSEDAIYVQRSQIRNSYGKSSSEDKFILNSLSTADTVEVTKTASDDKVFVSRSEIGPDYGKDDENFDIASMGSLDDETAENISMLYDIEARLNKLSSPIKDVQSDKEYSPLKYDDSSSSSSQLSAGFQLQESVEDQGSPDCKEKLSPAGDANDSVTTDRDSPITFSATENIESKDSKPYYNLSYVTDVSLNDSNNDSFKTPARQGLSLNFNNSSENLESSVQSDKIFVLREEIHSDYGGDLSNASSHSPSIDKCDLQSSPSVADANDSLSLSTEFSRNFISISKQVGGSEEFFLPYSVYDDSPDPALTSVDIRDEDYHTINQILNDGNEVDSNTDTPTFRRPSVESSSSCATFYSGIESDSNYTSVEEDVASEFEDEKSQGFQSMPQLFTGSPTLLGGSVMSVGSNISSSGLYSDGEGESEPSQINLDSTITDTVHLTSNLFQVASCEDVVETVSSQNFGIDDRKPGYEVIEYGANGVSICPTYSNDNNLTEIDGFCLNDLTGTVDRVSEPTGTLDIDIVEDCDPSVGDVNCEEYPEQTSSVEENKDQSLVVEDVTKSSDNISLLSLSTQELYESNDDLFVVEEKVEVKLSKFDGPNVSSSVGITIPSRDEVFSPVSEYFTDVDTYYTSADDDVTSAQEEECIDWSDMEQNLDCDSDNPDVTTVFDPDCLIEEEATTFINSSLISISTAECELSSQESIVAEEDLHDSGCKEVDMNSKVNKLKENMSLKEKSVEQFEVSHGSDEDEIFGENNPDNVTEKSGLVEGDVSVSPSSSCLSMSTTSCDSHDDSQSEPPDVIEELSDTESQNAKMNYKISLLKESRITCEGLLAEEINVSPCGSCKSLSTTCCSEDEYQLETVSVEEKLLDKARQDLNMNLKISLLKEDIADRREEKGKFHVSTEIETEVKYSFGCENQDETNPVHLDNESSCSESLDGLSASSRSNFNGMPLFGSRSDVDTYYTSADDDKASVLAEDCIEPCSPELYHRGLKEENISSDCEENCELIEPTEIIDSSFDYTELDGVSTVEMDKGEITSLLMSSKINALLKLQEEQAAATDDLESAKMGKECDEQPDDKSDEFTFEDSGLIVEDVSASPSGSCLSISTTCCSVDEYQSESIHAEEEFKDTTAQYFSMSLKLNQLMQESTVEEEKADATFEVRTRCDDEESEELSENISVDFEEETSCSDSKCDQDRSDISIPHNSLSLELMSRFSSRSDVDTYYTSADDDKASVLAEDCIEPSSSSSELHDLGVVEEDVPSDSSDGHYDDSQVMTFEDSSDITDSLFTEEAIGQEMSSSLMNSKIKALKTSRENQNFAPRMIDVSFSDDGSFEKNNFCEDFMSVKGVDIDNSPSNSCISLSTASFAGSTIGNLDEIQVEQSFTEYSSSQFDEKVNLILQGKSTILVPEISDSATVHVDEQIVDQADTGPGYVFTDVDTYYTSADDDCTSVAAEDCFVWTDECAEASSLIENSALDITVPACDLMQEDIYCEDQTSIIDQTGSSISDDHDESGLIIENAPSSDNEDNHQQILIEEAYFSENDQGEVPCAEFEDHLTDISQMVRKVKNLLRDRESSSVKGQNSGSEVSSSDETTSDKNPQQPSKCPPDSDENTEENEVLGFRKTLFSNDAPTLPDDSLLLEEGAGEPCSGPDKDIAVADDCFPSESNSGESLEEIPGIHIEDQPYSVTEDTEHPPDDNSSFELLEMSAVELLDLSDGQEICRTPDLSNYSVDCDQADKKIIPTDAETHYSSPDDDYASEGQFDCLPSKALSEQTNPIHDYDGLMTTVCLPDLGSIALNLSQSNVNEIQSPDSDLTPMNATDYEVTPVEASKSTLPGFNIEKDDTEDPLVDLVKNQSDDKEDLLADPAKNQDDNNEDASGNRLINQEDQYLGVSPSLSGSDSSLVIVDDSSVSHCSLEKNEELSCPEENIASTVEIEAIVPECYYSSANEAAASDDLTAYMSFENLPCEKPVTVSLVTENSLTKVSDLSEGQIEGSPSSIPIDSDVARKSSLDVSSPQPVEAKRVKKYRKKRKSSQNCPKIQGSSTSQDEHSDYVYVERPRPQTHKRPAAAVESTKSAIVTCEIKVDSASPTQSSKDLKDVDAQSELEVVEVPTSPCKDIIELNLSLEQNSFEKLRCAPEDTPVSIRRDSAAEGQGELEQRVDSDGSASPIKCTSVCQKDVEQGPQSCCPKLTQRWSEEPQLTEESELEFLTVLHGLKPIPKSEFFEVKRTVSPVKKKPSRRHMQSWARHLLSKTSSPEVVSGDTADDTEVLQSGNDFVALNPVETVVATPVESLLLSPISSPYGTLKRPLIFSGSRNRSSASNSSSDKRVEKKVDDEVEGIYFDGKNAPSKANKIHTTGLSSVLFDDKSTLSDVDEDMDKFEEELCRENFKLVMNELTFAVELFQTADSDADSRESPNGSPRTAAEPTEPMPSTSKSNFLDLSFCDSTCDDVSRVQEAIHQQYYNQVVREIKDWSYDPDCELDGDKLMARLRIHSEPSSSEGEPPPDCISRGAAMCGSDSEVFTPQKFSGLDAHPCPDSPYQKAHSMSVILKSRDTGKYKSKWKACRNPECEAGQRRRKRRSDRWKNWKILNQDGNPCETN